MASGCEMFTPRLGSSTFGCPSPCDPGLAGPTRSTSTAEPPSYTSPSASPARGSCSSGRKAMASHTS
eukprot:891716-Pyramimonas_sp.AAC.1